MTSLIAIFTNGNHRARVWQKSLSGFNYDIEFNVPYNGEKTKNLTVSCDEVFGWLTKEGFELVPFQD